MPKLKDMFLWSIFLFTLDNLSLVHYNSNLHTVTQHYSVVR